MIIGSARLTPAVAAQLAALQIKILPDSMVSRLGERFVANFYAYIASSPMEGVAWVEREGHVIAGCVVSLRPTSLNRRLLGGTSMLWWLVARLFHVGPLRLLRAVLPGGGPSQDLPELLLIYVDPHERSRRAGAALMQACEAFFARHGVREYLVKTFDDARHPALRFYLREGFVEQGRVSVYGTPFRVLRKRIAHTVA